MTVVELVDDLVVAAQKKGGFFFTQTLLRVGGIELVDPFEPFRADLSSGAAGASPKDTYCHWSHRDDFLRFIWNLVECAEERPYNAYALFEMSAPVAFGRQNWITQGKVAKLVMHLVDARRGELAEVITRCFPDGLLAKCADAGSEDTIFGHATIELAGLYGALLAASDRERRKFGTSNRFVRWPRFEVLEILANADIGLYGYRVHHSNGAHSEFLRLPGRADALNIQFQRDGQVSYFVGSLDDLRPEWRVGSKRLFEIGLEGRYNDLGKWKPIVYEGPVDAITNEIHALDDDLEVQGALFYIFTTAHWVVEFAVRATVDLPVENVVSFGPTERPIRLWKVPAPEHTVMNERLYDGWVSVASPTVEAVKLALAHIRIGMSRLAFVYDAELRWSLKYTMASVIKGLAKPKDEDLAKFDEVLVNEVPAELDLAISWVNAGRNASDPLTSFLCHFNAIESVVEGVSEGDLEVAGSPKPRETKASRLATRRDCMQAALDQHFPHDPNTFAKEVYFTCFKQLAKRRREVAEQLWGLEHQAFRDLFKRTEGAESLEDIRDEIAHGRISLLHAEEVRTVRKRLPRLAQIAKAMIIRVLLKKTAADSLSFWSGQHTIGINMNDPRSTMYANTLKILPATDWSIRAEWIGH
jgi:hypothetical protein